MRIRRSAPSRDLAAALSIWRNLAEVYSDMGRDAKAAAAGLCRYAKRSKFDSADMAPMKNDLAAPHERQSCYAEAEPLFKRALALPPGHPDVGQALDNLATLYKRQDRHVAPSRCSSGRWRSVRRFQVRSRAVATLLNNLGLVAPRRRRACDQSVARDPRTQRRRRSSRHPDVSEQPGLALPAEGRTAAAGKN